MPRSNHYRYFLLSFAVIALDQLTKILVFKNIPENGSVSILGDLLYFRFIYNEGGVMGTRIGPSWLYTILTLVALAFIIRYFVKSKSDGIPIKISLSLILGGALGNLIDRVFYGKVIDFIDVDFPDISSIGLYRWYTFNIADAAISTGLILFALSVLFKKEAPMETIDSTSEANAPARTIPPEDER
jgi:signal peptidase II